MKAQDKEPVWAAIAAKITMTDCGEDQLPPDEFRHLCGLKIAALRQILDMGYTPVNAFPDGRVIVGIEDANGKQWFNQIHAMKNANGVDWTVCNYPVDTVDGREMMTLEQQDEEFGKKLDFFKTELEVDGTKEGECNCPKCIAERIHAAHREARNERVLH